MRSRLLVQVGLISLPIRLRCGFESLVMIQFFPFAEEGDDPAGIGLDGEFFAGTTHSCNLHVEILRNVRITHQHRVSPIGLFSNTRDPTSAITDEEIQTILFKVRLIKAGKARRLH
jgi:hypothetical protein